MPDESINDVLNAGMSAKQIDEALTVHNMDCDLFIKSTFRRSIVVGDLTGEQAQELRISPIANEVVLNESQLRSLIHYLRTTFCANCQGTKFDPDSLNGSCEYCSTLPF